VVDVYINYVPPSGAIGYLGDSLGGSEYFSYILHQDLANFARLVEEAPSGVLDPMSSHYILHSASAVIKGQITRRQKARMANDPNMAAEVLTERLAHLREEQARKQQEQQELVAELKRKREEEERLRQELEDLMALEQERRLAEQREREEALALELAQQQPSDPLLDTLGGRGASMARTASGDRDGKRARHPGYERDPMTARFPLKPGAKPTRKLEMDEEMEKYESPWFRSIRGAPLPPPPAE
jgi:hypothetical protein